MNTSLTAYTHLESLLLFQSLNAYGVKDHIFSRISDLLKKNPSITSDKRYQSGRLSPDALRSFYLQILKEEVKSEQRQDAQDTDAQNGEVRNSRKRKAPSPSLPTVQQAAQHAHLIPKLVTKLYARYRTAITHEIRDDEDRYEQLQRELQSIEQGDRDSELGGKTNGTSPLPRSPTQSKKSPRLQQKPPPSASPQLAVQDGSGQTTPTGNAHVVDGPQQIGTDAQSTLAPPNGQHQVERNGKTAPGSSPRKKQGAPSTSQPPLGPGSVPSPQAIVPPVQFAQQQPPSAGFNTPPPPTHRSPYPQQGTQVQVPQRAPPANSHGPNQAPPHIQSAVPTPGQQYPPHPIQPFGGNGVAQFGHGPGQTPFSPSNQRPQPPGPQSPSTQTPQQQRNIYPYPGQSPYPPQQQAQAPQPPPQGGFMLPPFQVSPQDPSRAQQSTPHHPQVATPTNRALQSAAKPGSSAASSMRQGLPPLQPPVYHPRSSIGSVSTPLGNRTPYSATGTPRSAKTLWKPLVKNFATPPPPRPEIEPIDDIGSLDSQKQDQPKAKSTRKPRGKGKVKEKEEPENENEPDQEVDQTAEVETRQGRSRRKGTTTRRTRRGSITSSQAAGSTRDRSRSQSILSHTETIAAENESQAGTRVKSERGMSIDMIEEDSVGTPSYPATRRRGTTVASQSRSRKRNAREASLAESDDQPGSPGLPKVVIAPRHFSRMCNPIMNDIGSHKHASTFTTAVKAKDAEGYYEIIKRPTDLKSIQKAIAVGAKIVAAAATDTPAGSPGGGGGVVELPLGPDVMPPKAIVNSAQLEKELMRMFVNAVMFNAGEDGVVEDAREMFETCQTSISNWRSAERGAGRTEVEDTPVPEEEIVPTASKRRKL